MLTFNVVPRLSARVRTALIGVARVMQFIANRAQEEKKIPSEILLLVQKYENRIVAWADKLLVCASLMYESLMPQELTDGKYTEVMKFIPDAIYDDAVNQLFSLVSEKRDQLLEILAKVNMLNMTVTLWNYSINFMLGRLL